MNVSLSIQRKVIIICHRALCCLASLSSVPGDIKLINIPDDRIHILKGIQKLELEMETHALGLVGMDVQCSTKIDTPISC